MFLSIDRIVNGFAVCIDDFGNVFSIEVSKIKGEFKEGSIIISDGADGYIASGFETEKRQDELFALAESAIEINEFTSKFSTYGYSEIVLQVVQSVKVEEVTANSLPPQLAVTR